MTDNDDLCGGLKRPLQQILYVGQRVLKCARACRRVSISNAEMKSPSLFCQSCFSFSLLLEVIRHSPKVPDCSG